MLYLSGNFLYVYASSLKSVSGCSSTGAYDVQKSYEVSQIQHKYMPPRTFVARIKHASFLSTTPRCLDKVDDGPGK